MNPFKLARLSAGLTQTELAQLANVSSVMISRYETGGGKPSADRLLLMARVLNVTPEFLCPAREESVQKTSVAFREALARLPPTPEQTARINRLNRELDYELHADCHPESKRFKSYLQKARDYGVDIIPDEYRPLIEAALAEERRNAPLPKDLTL